MPRCLIALGSNLGDRSEQLRTALHEIALVSKTRLNVRSRWHETKPIGGPSGQKSFLNGAVLVDTCLTPEALHGQLLSIEKSLGRQRVERWAPRTLDLDLLLYDDQVCRTPTLELPHPRMSFRRFVLEPAAETAGWMLHPTSGWTVARLLRHLDTAAAYVAVTAIDSQDADWLAEHLAHAIGCPKVELSSLMEMASGGTVGSSAVEFAQAVVSYPWDPEGLKRCKLSRPKLPRPRLIVEWLGGAKNGQPFESSQVPIAKGPVARIDTADRQQALAEALAAAQAIWSR